MLKQQATYEQLVEFLCNVAELDPEKARYLAHKLPIFLRANGLKIIECPKQVKREEFWYYDAEDGTVGLYIEIDNGVRRTTREGLPDSKFLTTGFKTENDAIAFARTHGICSVCKSVTRISPNGFCTYCLSNGDEVKVESIGVCKEMPLEG